MEIRSATEQDCVAIAHIEETCLPSDPWSVGAAMGAVRDTDCPTLIALEGDEVIGYVTGRVLPPESELYRICTLPAWRGRGVARALFRAFRAALAARGCDTCFLEVRASNTPARALYASLGFAECGTRRNYYRAPTEDAVLETLKF